MNKASRARIKNALSKVHWIIFSRYYHKTINVSSSFVDPFRRQLSNSLNGCYSFLILVGLYFIIILVSLLPVFTLSLCISSDDHRLCCCYSTFLFGIRCKGVSGRADFGFPNMLIEIRSL